MVFEMQHPTHDVQVQRKTALLVALVGSIPLSIGKKLRRFIYRSMFGNLGTNVILDPDIEFIGAEKIFLGDYAAICDNAFLNAWFPNSKIIIHDRVRLDRGIHLQALGGRIEIDEMTYIGPYFCAAGPGNISIGKNCMIASHSSAYANNHIFSDPHIPIGAQGVTCEGIVIEDDCWLGTGVRVLDGVTIGRGSVIGAGAVVTKNILPYSIAVGVPAKVIGKRLAEDQYPAAHYGELALQG